MARSPRVVNILHDDPTTHLCASGNGGLHCHLWAWNRAIRFFFASTSFSMASFFLASRLHANFAVYRLHAILFYQFLWSTTCILLRAHGLLQLANLVTLVV